MWVPALVLVLATVLLWRPLRDLLEFESVMVFLVTAAGILALYQLDKLA